MPKMAAREPSPMSAYRAAKDSQRKNVLDSYIILGFISSGTYGKVYKARLRPPYTPALSSTPFNPTLPTRPGDLPGREGDLYAIKKFKPDKEGEVVTYTGISQSAIREIAINRELHHVNIATLREVILEEKSIYMVFGYAEHDFLQIIHHHSTSLRSPIPLPTLKSLLHQLLNGVLYLHTHHILHRDLKPANILVTSPGVVKIGDLGLARVGRDPLQGLWQGDKVVVTIWYRSPELLLGGRHYTGAVDMWAVGCIYAELLSLRPIFKGEEAKIDNKKNLPFQKDQMIRILEVLGSIDKDRWPTLGYYPDTPHLQRIERYYPALAQWYKTKAQACYSQRGYELLSALFEFDPERRITAEKALAHPWFTEEEPKPSRNCFAGSSFTYPDRRVSNDSTDDPKMQQTLPPTLPHAQPPSSLPVPVYGSSGPNSRPGSVGVGGGGLGRGGIGTGGGGGMVGKAVEGSRKRGRLG